MSERKRTRRRILQEPGFRETAKQVFDLLEGHRGALIGGLAVSWYANPPVTPDVDFLSDIPYEKLRSRGEKLSMQKWDVFPLAFVHRQRGLPQRGVGFEKAYPYISIDILLTGEDTYLLQVLTRAKLVDIQPGFSLPIVTAEDLVVMKTLVGRDKDFEDIKELRMALSGKLDEEYVYRTLEELES